MMHLFTSLCQGRVRPAADRIERVSNVSRTETAGREEESWCMKAGGGRTQTYHIAEQYCEIILLRPGGNQ